MGLFHLPHAAVLPPPPRTTGPPNPHTNTTIQLNRHSNTTSQSLMQAAMDAEREGGTRAGNTHHTPGDTWCVGVCR
jgi:hypothetical protein